MRLLLLLWLSPLVLTQNQCDKPNLSIPMKIICNNIITWDKLGRQTPIPVGRAGSAGLKYGPVVAGPSSPFPETIYDCMTIECICGFIPKASYSQGQCRTPDGSFYRKVQRKEYRMLTDDERRLYRRGFWAVRKTIYSELSIYHSKQSSSPAAHGGPAFLPWHREFMKRFEIGIRTTPIDGKYPFVNVAVPYWDSTIDADIYDTLGISSKHSTMFSADLMGSVHTGHLVDGQFGSFQGYRGYVKRDLDQWPGDLTIPSRPDIDAVIYKHSLNDVLAANSKAGEEGCPPLPDNYCEWNHGMTHVWVGADMQNTTTSTNDPIFFLHHSFVDFIFEQWRQKRQTRAQRETQYNTAPDHCYGPPHRFDSVMVPFSNFIISDGFSNQYTDNLYNYAPRPTCSSTAACPSRFYWCNVEYGRCAAKITPGSECKIVRGVDPCYESVCSDGTCIAAKKGKEGGGAVPPPPEEVPVPDQVATEVCYNRQPCCDFIANPTTCADVNTKTQCPASCKQCTPNTYKQADDCSNRHSLCSVFKGQGMCQSQVPFMAENCRKECDLCGTSRKDTCGKVQGQPSPGTGGPGKTPPYPSVPGGSGVPPNLDTATSGGGVRPSGPTTPEESQPSAPQCFNNDRCCTYWAQNNGCQKNSQMMKKVCPASCTCTPIFDVKKNSNFIKQCPVYAAKGLCWLEFMKENCRRSCNSYLSPSQQEQQCTRY